DCLPGFYCSGTSNPSPTGPCYAGHFCTGSASTPTQYTTGIGHYAPIGSAVQHPCLDCTAGYYCEEEATLIPVQCPVGHYCEVGSAVPTECPPGTFSNVLGLQLESDCNNCTAGR
ncbi:unnamed protein product, partial [Pylaiella littoralis]